MVARTKLTNEALDLRYAQYRSDGTTRDDGGGSGTFWSIGRYAYDPAKVHSGKVSKTKKNMSVYEAVGRDPQYAHINADVYDQGLWRLLSRPEVNDAELEDIITTALRRQGLYRPKHEDRILGKQFLKDKSAFYYAGSEEMQNAFFKMTGWHSVAGLTLLAALSREYLRHGMFEHVGLLKFEFEHCLMTVAYQHGFSKDLQLLIQWLANFRIFSNRWDVNIPNAWSRSKALAHFNRVRKEQGQKPLPKPDFWVEALAVRYHTTQLLFKYAPVPSTPQLEWLEQNRERLTDALKAWDYGQDTDDLWSPLF